VAAAKERVVSEKRKAPAMEVALGALARRARSAAEIDAFLRRKGYGATDIAGVVARLKELGYVDDAQYALSLATRLAAERGWGPRRVREELARRGVTGEIVEAALERAAEEGAGPAASLDRALEKLIRRHGVPRERREQNRIRAALLRRGFSPEDVSGALASLGSAADDDRWEET